MSSPSTRSAEATTTRFTTTVTSVGPEAQDMVDGGVLILFGEPVPPALADISVVHRTSAPLDGVLEVGDLIECDGSSVTITAVGDLATSNLTELGHVVLYGAPATGTTLLPGAVHTDAALPLPAPGAVLRITRRQR